MPTIENKPSNAVFNFFALSSLSLNLAVKSLKPSIILKRFSGLIEKMFQNASFIGVIKDISPLKTLHKPSIRTSLPPKFVTPSTRSRIALPSSFVILVASFSFFKVASSTIPVTLRPFFF